MKLHDGLVARSLMLIVLLATVGASTAVAVSGCGGSDQPADAATVAPQVSSPSVAGVPTPSAGLGYNAPSDEVLATLDARIAAMNRGDAEAAAACYSEDAVMEETDLDPDGVTRGRRRIQARLADLYGMGLRLEAAGAPIQYDRYVAEPVYFYNPDGGYGAGILVFEMDWEHKIAYQWVIGWLR